MSEKLVEISPKFSIADAEIPEICLVDNNLLRVKFLDYREAPVELEFTEIMGFKWSIEELEFLWISDDGVYEVKNSSWLEAYRKSGETVSKHKHYKLCFNGSGFLDIIFLEMKL